MDKEHLHIDAKIAESRPTACDDKSSIVMDGKTNGYSSGSLGNFGSEEAIQKRDFGGNLVNVPNVYRQDVVKCNKDSGMVGIVTEVGGDLDSESDTTDDDDDEGEDEEDKYEDDEEEDDGDNDDGDEDENDNGSGNNRTSGEKNKDPLPVGQVRVIWINHSETTQSLEEVTVIDRAFLHGDIVAPNSDPTGQVGIVADVNISVDLLDQDGSVIKDVSARDLKRVRDFTVGDYVVLGPWLGRVDDVLDNVTVLFDDGSMCKVMKIDPLRLKPVSKCLLEDGNFPYYPGQRVRASSSSIFKNARWLSGSWKASRLEGMVTKVTVGSVFIYWIASAGYGSESTSAPAEEQGPKNLKLLSCLSHANWQVGDWCFLPSHKSSSYISEDKNSSIIMSEVPSNGKLPSGALEGEHVSEPVCVEKADGNRPSFASTEPMALDTVHSLDKNSEYAEGHTSPESSPCSSSLSVSKEHENWPLRRKKMRKVVVRRDKKARKKEENFDRALLIVNTRTRVDVAWQDGKPELGLASTNLIPIDSPGDQEFLPEQYVVEKASGDNDNDNACEVRRVGVVKSVSAKERTACVRWLKPVSRPEDPREFDKDEIVSVYELEVHPDYDYCYGDVVVRLSPISVSANMAGSANLVEETGLCGDSNDAKKNLKMCFIDEKVEDESNSSINADFSDLSWVGNITGLKDGDIVVTWANGMVSTVGPQAIYVVGRDDDDEASDYGSDISDGAVSWETVNEDEMDTLENAEEEAGPQNDSTIIRQTETTVHSEDSNSGGNGALAIPLAALGFVTRLATGFFSRRRKQIDPLCSDYCAENVPQSPGIIDALDRTSSIAETSSQQSNKIDSCPIQAVIEDSEEQGLVSEATEVEEPLCSLRSEEPDAQSMLGCTGHELCSFKRFETAKDPLDHFFLGANGQSTNERKWLKKVQQDWSILQKNLPESIYVRVYEDRMDLLRAVIVGAYGTPYQDGLFVFDFHLPPEYPQCPPSAHYHSGGWRINPNLYEEGKVCLSLLNTWTGRGNEVWDPSSSSILQILVSLQGLVLNSKPYFNEAGYDRQVGTAEGEKNSLSYNENTFLLNCKSMMYLMRKPPKDFEELVKDHFRRRGYYILKACDAYMRGYLIGSLTKDASISEKSYENSTSVGFKLMLAKIIPKLVSALSEVGADVNEFKHLQQSVEISSTG